MTLEVIGAGFGRTGTNSLQTALHELGYGHCHHMYEVMPSIQQIEYFLAAAKGEKMDWDAVFEGFDAAVDWPSSKYYKELAEYYPQAKVILSVREPEGWYKSTRETIFEISNSSPRWMVALIPRVRKTRAMINATIWEGVFDGRFADKDHAIKVFEENIQEVKRTIPEQQLLIHEAKDGWEPLCEFLNKPVPSTPYPRTNDSADMFKRIKTLKRLQLVPWVLAAALVSYFLV